MFDPQARMDICGWKRALVLLIVLGAGHFAWLADLPRVVRIQSIANSSSYDLTETVLPNSNSSICPGKERLVDILRHAGLTSVPADVCNQLPTWDEVTALYGDEPIFVGLERCQMFRAGLSGKPKPRVDGLFNSGTNAMALTLHLNFEAVDNYRVGYNIGKHTSLTEKDAQGALPFPTDIMPIVLVRDPYRWMQSMCRMPYLNSWDKGQPGHCPNLVPSDEEKHSNPMFHNMSTFQVLNRFNTTFDSLADWWSIWYNQYLDADFPRLIVRFEDIHFHPEKVMDVVSTCIGVPMEKPFQYALDRAKPSLKSADLIRGMILYGTSNGRMDGIQAQDIEYARHALDERLMKLFHYKYLEVNGTLNLI